MGRGLNWKKNHSVLEQNNIVTYMEITKFVVNERLILIIGTDVGTIEVYYLDETSSRIDKDHQKLIKIQHIDGFQPAKRRDLKLQSTLMKHFSIEKDKDLQVVKLKYARDVGLIVCALNDSKAKGIL